MDTEEFREVIKNVWDDDSMIQPNISVRHAFMIISALQLAIQHPDMSEDLKKTLTGVGYTFQDSVVAVHPEAREAMSEGWNVSRDTDDNDDEFDDPFWSEEEDGEDADDDDHLPFDDSYLDDDDLDESDGR